MTPTPPTLRQEIEAILNARDVIELDTVSHNILMKGILALIEVQKQKAVEEALDLYIKETSFGTELPMFVNRREYVLDKLFPRPQ